MQTAPAELARASHSRAQVRADIQSVDAAAFTIPTDRPESDGTLEWDSTTINVAEARAAGVAGVGYTYTSHAAAAVIQSDLAPIVRGMPADQPERAWWAMRSAARNLPARGLVMCAISAVDAALWDLAARLAGLPIAALLGAVRDEAPAYGSGGFTSYSTHELQEQLADWVEKGLPRVKMKVGRDPAADPARVRAAREAIGKEAQLFVDANGAYTVPQAVALAHEFAEAGVSWLEEPRPSDDVRGLSAVRAGAPAGMDIAGGEYCDTEESITAILDAGAVDVLQPDVTRCGGFTGLRRAAAICGAQHTPISLHCAPSLSAHAACALREVRHVEWFHDHARIEHMIFDGAPSPSNGALRPDRGSPGLGLRLRREEAHRFRA